MKSKDMVISGGSSNVSTETIIEPEKWKGYRE